MSTEPFIHVVHILLSCVLRVVYCAILCGVWLLCKEFIFLVGDLVALCTPMLPLPQEQREGVLTRALLWLGRDWTDLNTGLVPNLGSRQ